MLTARHRSWRNPEKRLRSTSFLTIRLTGRLTWRVLHGRIGPRRLRYPFSCTCTCTCTRFRLSLAAGGTDRQLGEGRRTARPDTPSRPQPIRCKAPESDRPARAPAACQVPVRSTGQPDGLLPSQPRIDRQPYKKQTVGCHYFRLASGRPQQGLRVGVGPLASWVRLGSGARGFLQTRDCCSCIARSARARVSRAGYPRRNVRGDRCQPAPGNAVTSR